MKLKNYTVLLLRPEDICDDPYSTDARYHEQVRATSPAKAAAKARENATKADMRDEDLEPADYAVLFVCEGHPDNLAYKADK